MRSICLRQWFGMVVGAGLATVWAASSSSAEAPSRPPRMTLPTPAAAVKMEDQLASPPPSSNPARQPLGESQADDHTPPARLEAAPLTPQAGVAGSADAADAPLEPVPEPKEDGLAKLEAASFNGVTPGKTPIAEVERAWGAAKEVRKQEGVLTHLYAVEPFDRVEVTFFEDKATAIVIRLNQAFPAEAVAKQLQLGDVRPVLVSNEMGEILGQAFPERGVLFAFAPGEPPTKPSMKVAQIILEPLSAEPFVLRAETRLESHVKASLADLEQAIKLDPKNARAQWLLARALAAAGECEKALAAVNEAIRIEPENPHYHVCRAQVLGQLGQVSEATAAAEKALATAESRPHVRARALCLLGDLAASGARPDYKQAIRYHGEAVKAADALVEEKHPAIRLAAKEVLVDAHLGAAHDIAWGDWKDKETAVARWLERAANAAEDLVGNEGAGEEHRFHVCTRALAACVGLRGGIDPATWAKGVLETGQELIDNSHDPIRKSQLQWDLGMALYDALQSYQMRGDHATAMKYGEQAIAWLESADQGRQSAATAYLLGRLYFRLGAIHSLKDKDHRAAVAWFEKAVPLLEKPIPTEAVADLGRLGETFVSMGVSYWEVGQHKQAVDLTTHGVELLEQAARQGTIEAGSLAIPYGNLASMHRQLGSGDAAARYQKLAARVRSGTVQ